MQVLAYPAVRRKHNFKRTRCTTSKVIRLAACVSTKVVSFVIFQVGWQQWLRSFSSPLFWQQMIRPANRGDR